MADATSKIRIRMGQIEIEYEGAHDFLSKDLPKLLEAVVALKAQAGEDPGSERDPASQAAKPKTGSKTGTVAAFAAKLGGSTGPDLLIAAAAKLTFVDGDESFSRGSLLKAMQSATSYYKQGMSGNLTKMLKTLLDANRLTEPSTNNYALTAAERSKLEAQLNAG